MDPLQLSGPTFLMFFVLAGLGVAAATVALRHLVARALRRDDPESIARGLHPTEVAFLLQGVERAVEAAVAGLHHRGVIELHAGTLKHTGAREPAVAPEGVFRGVAAAPGRAPVEDFVVSRLPATIDELCSAAHSAHLPVVLRARLEDEDLLVRGEHVAWLVRLPVLAWLSLGGLKLLVGLAHDRPVGVLCFLLGLGVWMLLRLARAPRLTRLGEAVASELRASAALQATAQTAPQQLSGAEMSLACAIFGYTVAPAALMSVMPSFQAAVLATSTSGPGASGGGGCGSSCGSSCGGGCGGCGGCS